MKLVSEMPKGCRFIVIGQYKSNPCCDMLEEKYGVVYRYNEQDDDWIDELDSLYFQGWEHLQYYVAS